MATSKAERINTLQENIAAAEKRIAAEEQRIAASRQRIARERKRIRENNEQILKIEEALLAEHYRSSKLSLDDALAALDLSMDTTAQTGKRTVQMPKEPVR
jgi:predicted  nucleic acid-binding Zn-ribbon protein